MDYEKVIKSVSYNQHEILMDIMSLYNNGNPFDCDMTYSIGAFYGHFDITDSKGEKIQIDVPEPRIKFDVLPQREDVIKIEPLGPLPLEDSSIHSCVIDLPFIISVGPSMNEKSKTSNLISNRFGAYYPVSNLLESYYHWIKEIYRVLDNDGLCIMKDQSCITGGKALNTPYYSWMMADSIGFDEIDDFILIAKNRIHSGKIKKQQHSRRYESHFQVFKKSLKKKIHYLSFCSDLSAKEIMDNFMKNNK